ncbi:hypothetical protein AC249_AIPGENE28570 [Exaiptasia diaphana]|nr:hypothetical protein AC249_AIPGENE28570 [Exaiptasia diaphana]
MVSRLVEEGVDPVAMLPSQRSPIHVAVDRGHVTCVSILIGRSQGIDVQKPQHDNAIRKSTFNSVASLLKKKRGWKKIVEQWDHRKQRQAEKTKLPFMPRKEFQKIDSQHHSYIAGSLGRIYMCSILQTEARGCKKQFTKPWY